MNSRSKVDSKICAGRRLEVQILSLMAFVGRSLNGQKLPAAPVPLKRVCLVI